MQRATNLDRALSCRCRGRTFGSSGLVCGTKRNCSKSVCDGGRLGCTGNLQCTGTLEARRLWNASVHAAELSVQYRLSSATGCGGSRRRGPSPEAAWLLAWSLIRGPTNRQPDAGTVGVFLQLGHLLAEPASPRTGSTVRARRRSINGLPLEEPGRLALQEPQEPAVLGRDELGRERDPARAARGERVPPRSPSRRPPPGRRRKPPG